MRALIVDDEPLARQLIREYLADFPQIQVLAECGDGENAVKTHKRRTTRPSLPRCANARALWFRSLGPSRLHARHRLFHRL